MHVTHVCTLTTALLLSACAVNEIVPVAVEFPPPPPAPRVLTLPASTGPSISTRTEDLLKAFEDSLTKAQRQP